MENQVQGARQGADHKGFGQAGHTLEDAVTSGHSRDQHFLDHVSLAYDDLADLIDGLREFFEFFLDGLFFHCCSRVGLRRSSRT